MTTRASSAEKARPTGNGRDLLAQELVRLVAQSPVAYVLSRMSMRLSDTPGRELTLRIDDAIEHGEYGDALALALLVEWRMAQKDGAARIADRVLRARTYEELSLRTLVGMLDAQVMAASRIAARRLDMARRLGGGGGDDADTEDNPAPAPARV